MTDGQPTPTATVTTVPPPPGEKCGTCGKEREVKMSTPAKSFGNAPAKGVKFRSMATKSPKRATPQRQRKRDPRFVRYY